MNSSDALRYLNFSLPHHWLKKSETLSINQEWQTQWQPFIYKISKMLQINPDWRLIIQHEVKTYLGLPSKIKRNDKSMFNELFEIMKHELGDECLSGLFKGFDSNNNKRQTNLLWVTLSGFSRAEGVRHPLYWLSIIFWLRNKLPAYQAII